LHVFPCNLLSVDQSIKRLAVKNASEMTVQGAALNSTHSQCTAFTVLRERERSVTTYSRYTCIGLRHRRRRRHVADRSPSGRAVDLSFDHTDVAISYHLQITPQPPPPPPPVILTLAHARSSLSTPSCAVVIPYLSRQTPAFCKRFYSLYRRRSIHEVVLYISMVYSK